MTPYEAQLVQAAQNYDHAHRPPRGLSWTRVPDDQVLRLLIGAGLIRPSDGRPCTILDQIRWAFEFARNRYGSRTG